MHQTKKIKNNRSNVMAWSIELVIRVMDLTEFNMFSHKSIVNLNILKNTKKKATKRPAMWAYACERKNQSVSAFKLKPTRLGLLFLFSFKGVDNFFVCHLRIRPPQWCPENEVCYTRTSRRPIKKIILIGKETDTWHLVLWGKRSCSRSRHLVLWSLGTLTGQHKFYGTRLVTQNGRCNHPLNVLPEADCIAGFV